MIVATPKKQDYDNGGCIGPLLFFIIFIFGITLIAIIG